MEKTLKQPVLVVNRSGAGGAVGTTAVAKAAPDGYTILMSLSSISIFPVSDPINGKPAPYQLADFAPIALITSDPTVLVVAADGPYKTIHDFIASAKAHPGKINYSSSGVYGTLHVAMEMFANAAGIKLFHVPYQGGGPASPRCGRPGARACLRPRGGGGADQGGKMLALVGWGDKRLRCSDLRLQDWLQDVDFYICWACSRPLRPPAPAGQAARRGARAVRPSSGAMEKVQTPISYLDAPQFRDFLARDAARLRTAVEKIGKVDEK